METDPFVQWLHRNVHQRPAAAQTGHLWGTIRGGIPVEDVWNSAHAIAQEKIMEIKRDEHDGAGWGGRGEVGGEGEEGRGGWGEVREGGGEGTIDEKKGEDQQSQKVEEQEKEEKIAPLTALSARVVAEHIGAQPQKFVKALLNLPVELASLVISFTSPICVESLFALRMAQIHRNDALENTLVSLMRLMYAIEEYEFQYLTFCKKFNKTPPAEQWSPPLIDVWCDYDSFYLETTPSQEENEIGKICFATKTDRPLKGEKIHSVADEETFRTNFSIFTERQLEGWTEWDNMVVIGGSVVASLLPVPEEYKDKKNLYFHEIAYPVSDIDIYIYGLDIEEFAKKVDRLYHHFTKVNGEVLVVRSTFTVTFCSTWPKRHIQIVMGKWNNIAEILFEPDIDCTCVAYDGCSVWATQRSRFSYNYRCIITSQKRYSVRGFPEYEGRLIKYSKRGFYIWDKMMAPDFSNISLRFLMIGKSRITEQNTVEGRAEIMGLRLVLIGYLWARTLATNNVRFFATYREDSYRYKNDGLPYGPTWNLAKISKHLQKTVQVEASYTKEVESPYKVIKDIIDWQTIVSPHRDKLVDMYVEVQCKDLSITKDWDIVEKRRKRACFFHCNIFVDQDQKELEKGEMTQDCCHYTNHYRRRSISEKHNLDCVWQPTRSAKALFMHRIGDPKAEEAAQEQGICLEDYTDDPYEFRNYPRSMQQVETTHPLLRPLLRGDIEAVSELIKQGYDITLPDSDGITPLQHALKRGLNPEMLRLLVRNGADINACDEIGMTPLHWACMRHTAAGSSLVTTIIEIGANVDAAEFGHTPLEMALDNYIDQRHAKELLKAGARTDSVLGAGFMTPLHLACLSGRMASLLLKNGNTDPEARCGDGMTPLLLAASAGNEFAVRKLLQRGADLDAADDFGETPLIAACEKGHALIARMLVEAGADVSAERKDGATALTIAYRKENHTIVHYVITCKKLFLQQDKSELFQTHPDTVDWSGTGQYDPWVDGQEWEAYPPQELYLPKSDLEYEAFSKGKPFFEAAEKNEITPQMRALAPNWARVRGTILDRTPLQWASFYGNCEMVELLLANGAEVDYRGDEYTPLCEAARRGHLEVAVILLEHGASVHGKGEKRKKLKEHQAYYFDELQFEESDLEEEGGEGEGEERGEEGGEEGGEDGGQEGGVEGGVEGGEEMGEKRGEEEGGEGGEEMGEEMREEGGEEGGGKGEEGGEGMEEGQDREVDRRTGEDKEERDEDDEARKGGEKKERGKKEREISENPIFWAVHSRSVAIVKLLFEKGAEMNPFYLRMAVQNKDEEMVELLAEKTKNEVAGEMLLHWAAFNGWVKGAEILIKSGLSQVREKCGDGMTPLHYAIWGGQVEMVKKLVDLGAKIEDLGN